MGPAVVSLPSGRIRYAAYPGAAVTAAPGYAAYLIRPDGSATTAGPISVVTG